jgi:hypothetical protein
LDKNFNDWLWDREAEQDGQDSLFNLLDIVLEFGCSFASSESDALAVVLRFSSNFY